MKLCVGSTEELVSSELGPLAEQPTFIFANQIYSYYPVERMLVVTLIIPLPSEKLCSERAYDTFVQHVTAWSTDPEYCTSLYQTCTTDFATLIDFTLNIIRLWHYNQILPHAYYFWPLIIPGTLSPSARWAMLSFFAPYFRNIMRWQ